MFLPQKRVTEMKDILGCLTVVTILRHTCIYPSSLQIIFSKTCMTLHYTTQVNTAPQHLRNYLLNKCYKNNKINVG